VERNGILHDLSMLWFMKWRGKDFTIDFFRIILSMVLKVRSLCPLADGRLASSSRDGTIRIWKKDLNESDGRGYSCEAILKWHESFVNSLTFIQPNEIHPNGLLVSGGADSRICIGPPEPSNSPLYVLMGHDENVCALDVVPDSGLIVSGSWDKTARLWTYSECIDIFRGHESAVWAVLGLTNGDIITGSADKTIKIWRNGTCFRTLLGHDDCVRGLRAFTIPAARDRRGFVSCGNDAHIIVWSLEGDRLETLDGHHSFIYSVTISNRGEIISSGEDRTIRVWKGG
jgi:phospholipase A-2-activating protein